MEFIYSLIMTLAFNPTQMLESLRVESTAIVDSLSGRLDVDIKHVRNISLAICFGDDELRAQSLKLLTRIRDNDGVGIEIVKYLIRNRTILNYHDKYNLILSIPDDLNGMYIDTYYSMLDDYICQDHFGIFGIGELEDVAIERMVAAGDKSLPHLIRLVEKKKMSLDAYLLLGISKLGSDAAIQFLGSQCYSKDNTESIIALRTLSAHRSNLRARMKLLSIFLSESDSHLVVDASISMLTLSPELHAPKLILIGSLCSKKRSLVLYTLETVPKDQLISLNEHLESLLLSDDPAIVEATLERFLEFNRITPKILLTLRSQKIKWRGKTLTLFNKVIDSCEVIVSY